MAAQSKAKPSKGTRNDARQNGKRWSQGKTPEVRAAEAKKRTETKQARKAMLAKLGI